MEMCHNVATGLFYSHCLEKGSYTGPLTQLREAHPDVRTLVFWKGITLH